MKIPKGLVVDSVETLVPYYRSIWKLDHEEFWVVGLDENNKVIFAKNFVETTSLHRANISIRKVFKELLSNDCYNVYLCHNHPTTPPIPSDEDKDITNCIRKVCKEVGITLKGHMITAVGYMRDMITRKIY